MELVPVCSWCPTQQEIPPGKAATDTICPRCLFEYFPDEAPHVLALQQARTKIELFNPLLVPQTF